MDDELIRRITDLASRCSRSASVTHTGFLTPAEVFRIEHWSPSGMNCGMLLHGGVDSAERRVAFFLPEWMDVDTFDIGEYLCALEFTARFGSPGHRDYLGAALALGIGREWIGDIIIDGGNSHFSDTIRRAGQVEKAGMYYIGVGVSGGEEGALKGPSLMPGGSAAARGIIVR